MPFLSFSKAYYAGLGIKRYLRTPNYIQPYYAADFFFRYSYYENKFIENINGSSFASYATQQSEYERTAGVKLLWGARTVSTKLGNAVLALDVFIGISLRIKITDRIVYGRTYQG